MTTTADRVLDKLQASYGLKPNGPNKYRCNSPLRPGSNSHAMALMIEDDEHGTFYDHVAGEGGSLYKLADHIGIDHPKGTAGELMAHASLTTKIPYADLDDYAQAHGVTGNVFRAAGWGDAIAFPYGDNRGRPALPFTTKSGMRHRFIDGAPKPKPTYTSPSKYRKCWYRLEQAALMAGATGQPLVLCNGEASTVVAHHYEVAAAATTGGEGHDMPAELLAELQATYSGPVLIALDCDETGRTGATKLLVTLTEAGYNVRAVDLNGTNGFDLADFCRLNGTGTADALASLHDIGAPPKAAKRAPEPSCRPLPPEARLDPALAAQASPWLDAYIAFSRKWSSSAYEGFHEACGLWLLSTLAARRIGVPLGEMKYSSLYIALCARTSIWAKSTTAQIAKNALKQVGADFLLAPDECTPQALIRQMAGPVPAKYGEMLDIQQERERNRLGFAGQRGWWYDEFGQKLAGMMREGGSMQDFHGLLRQIDVSPDSYSYSTIARGADEIERPYLSLLASLTPADLAPYAQAGGKLWNDGFFARFAFVAPPPDAQPSMDIDVTQGKYSFPPDLIMTLYRWHDRLGKPIVDIEERTKNGKGTGEYIPTVTPAETHICTLSDEAEAAYKAYFLAMRRLVISGGNTDMEGSYTRFVDKALRIAMLLASLENDGVIELRHWARGQQVAEQWRANLHNLIDQLSNQGSMSKAAILEDRIVQKVLHLGGATLNDLRRHLHISTEEAARVVGALVAAESLSVTINTKGTKKYYVPEGAEPIVATVATVASSKQQNIATIDSHKPLDASYEPIVARDQAVATSATRYDCYDCPPDLPSSEQQNPPVLKIEPDHIAVDKSKVQEGLDRRLSRGQALEAAKISDYHDGDRTTAQDEHEDTETAKDDALMVKRIKALILAGHLDVALQRVKDLVSPQLKAEWRQKIQEAQSQQVRTA